MLRLGAETFAFGFANAKTKLENGFDLTNYDERTLAFAKDYSNQLLAIDVNLDTIADNRSAQLIFLSQGNHCIQLRLNPDTCDKASCKANELDIICRRIHSLSISIDRAQIFSRQVLCDLFTLLLSDQL